MMAQKCVHKGCGKTFSDPEQDCLYHPGLPEFHEGQKGWKCCKPRVLIFDEFLNIPPCTTGKHSTVDDTPESELAISSNKSQQRLPPQKSISVTHGTPTPASGPRVAQAPQPAVTGTPPPRPESESDDPSLPIPSNATCRRRGCSAVSTLSTTSTIRDNEECVFHPGQAHFHEGSKGWTCCKRRVLEFDEFMKIEGCKRKKRHLFVGSGKKAGTEETLSEVRHDFYQTSTTVIASYYLKRIDKERARVKFSSSTTVELDLPTTDMKRYKTELHLFGPVDPGQSAYKILGTKLELILAKSDGQGWPVLRSDEERGSDIIQVGQAGRA